MIMRWLRFSLAALASVHLAHADVEVAAPSPIAAVKLVGPVASLKDYCDIWVRAQSDKADCVVVRLPSPQGSGPFRETAVVTTSFSQYGDCRPAMRH